MPQTRGAGGGGAGGNGSPGSYSTNATENTGSGGGGSGNGPTTKVVRVLQVLLSSVIKSDRLPTAKATGGSVSFYGGKTIHTFVTSGTFATAPNWSAVSVEYVVIGGGGGWRCHWRRWIVL